VTRWLLGIVPGVRAMALDDVRRGWPYAVAGLAVALAFALVATGWSSNRAVLPRLRVARALELVDAACLVALAVAYEGLRLASALEERRRRPAAPRVVACPFIPAVLVAWMLPGLVHHAPDLLEPTWWASLVLGVGSSGATLWCLFEDALHTRLARRRLVIGWAAGWASVLAVLAFSSVLLPDVASTWAARAEAAGFRLLPVVLGVA
jgi:hypothetical protein